MADVTTIPPEVLQLKSKLGKARQQGEAWPMLVFDQVLAVASMWGSEEYKAIFNKKTFNQFLRSDCGLGASCNLAFFKRVNVVVNALGESSRRGWVWRAAQWVYNHAEGNELKAILSAYPLWVRENDGAHLSVGMVSRRVKQMSREVKKAA